MRLTTNLLLCLIMLGTATTAFAVQVDQGSGPVTGPEYGQEAPGQETFQGGGKTLSQAVEQVRRQYNGQIVSAETRVSGNRETHIIKVLTKDGTVKTVRVPGRRLN
jgi:hypothetical protein